MKDILKKYSQIKFVDDGEKNDFFLTLENLYKNLKSKKNKGDFLDILEGNFLEFTHFDSKILYNPFELFDALIENDLLGDKFDNDEIDKTLSNLDIFQNYLDKKISEKKYLEKIYNIKILLQTENILSSQSGIYGAGLGKIGSAQIIHKLHKLLDDYPIIFIKNIKLHQIIIVSYFFKVDQYGNKTQLGGFETLGDDNIYLSYRNLIDSFDHELFHQATQYYDDSKSWEELRKNQKLFYTYSEIDEKSLGFARNYGKENIAEDQATIAEQLFLNYKNIIQRSHSDYILGEKIALVKKAYLQLSEGLMDENFWSHRK